MAWESVSARAIGLGKPLGRCNNHWDLGRFLAPLGSVLVGVVVLGVPANFMGKQAGPMGVACFTIVGAGFIIGGVVMVISLLREGLWEVEVFEDGMLITRGARETVLRWADVRSLRVDTLYTFSIGEEDGIPVYAYRRCHIETDSEGESVFGGHQGEQLAAVIRERALEPMLARLLDRYRDGETLRLGNVEVSRQGITTDAGYTSWEDVEEVNLASDGISIVPRGGGGSRKAEASASLADSFLLPELLQVIAGAKLTKQASRTSRQLSQSFGPLVACPYCGERIPKDAIDCIYCGREVYHALQGTRKAARRT